MINTTMFQVPGKLRLPSTALPLSLHGILELALRLHSRLREQLPALREKTDLTRLAAGKLATGEQLGQAVR